MIKIDNLTFHYGLKPVLRNIDLEVREGEVLALMGPNGMGKSTLVALIAGMLPPISGSIAIDGHIRRSTPDEELAIRKRVAYLPAEPWLPKLTTGREWIMAVGRLYDIPDTQLLDHAQRLVDLFDLRDQADSPMTSYSSGQKKKIALCATLITEAPILLLDEPFAGGLDPSGIVALKKVLQHLAARDDVTIVIATPVAELVEELADRVAIISEGRISAIGTLAELRSQSGCSGSLIEVYDRLVHADAKAHVEKYFSGEKA